MPSAAPPHPAQSAERRVIALDGVRGFMTILVVVSHYFGEVPHGASVVMFGRIAVDMFFVLSGFLVGNLILEKMHDDNFFKVFYIRRVCRTLPIYVVSVLLITAVLALGRPEWADADSVFPLWSYLTFTQTLFMAATQHLGAHWLAPTWTLAVEEHFYLVAPLTFFLVPRRYLPNVLIAAAAAAVLCRAAVALLGWGNPTAASVLLPGTADILICGLLAAIVSRTEAFRRGSFDGALRIMPVMLLFATACLTLAAGPASALVAIFRPLLISAACAMFLLSIVRNAPEARRFHSPVLRFFGRTSYAVYLTHLPILGLAHGLILQAPPDVSNLMQWMVTLAALPLCVLAAWLLTTIVEEPITRYGRSWRWSGVPRAARQPAAGRAAEAPITLEPTGRA